jgi:hypothetical protein
LNGFRIVLFVNWFVYTFRIHTSSVSVDFSFVYTIISMSIISMLVNHKHQLFQLIFFWLLCIHLHYSTAIFQLFWLITYVWNLLNLIRYYSYCYIIPRCSLMKSKVVSAVSLYSLLLCFKFWHLTAAIFKWFFYVTNVEKPSPKTKLAVKKVTKKLAKDRNSLYTEQVCNGLLIFFFSVLGVYIWKRTRPVLYVYVCDWNWSLIYGVFYV